MKWLLMLPLILPMFGCQSLNTPLDDGYQFGDVVKTGLTGTEALYKYQQDYCQNGDLLAKSMLITMIRVVVPAYPEDGICTDLTYVALYYLENQETHASLP